MHPPDTHCDVILTRRPKAYCHANASTHRHTHTHTATGAHNGTGGAGPSDAAVQPSNGMDMDNAATFSSYFQLVVTVFVWVKKYTPALP